MSVIYRRIRVHDRRKRALGDTSRDSLGAGSTARWSRLLHYHRPQRCALAMAGADIRANCRVNRGITAANRGADRVRRDYVPQRQTLGNGQNRACASSTANDRSCRNWLQSDDSWDARSFGAKRSSSMGKKTKGKIREEIQDFLPRTASADRKAKASARSRAINRACLRLVSFSDSLQSLADPQRWESKCHAGTRDMWMGPRRTPPMTDQIVNHKKRCRRARAGLEHGSMNTRRSQAGQTLCTVPTCQGRHGTSNHACRSQSVETPRSIPRCGIGPCRPRHHSICLRSCQGSEAISATWLY